MSKEWQWWGKSRYIIIPNFDTWSVIDCAYNRPVFEGLPLLDAYREAVQLNEMEIEYDRQPA